MSPIVHIRRQDLELITKIGEGGYGAVYHMLWKKTAKETIHVAAKKMYVVDKNELEILSRLSHPNIVCLIGVVPEELDFMLILELCEGGSLRSYLDQNEKRPLPEKLFKIWSKQAAKAIQYLNHMNIVHKDIKCDNYLITKDKILKLADFGLAREIEQTLSNATQTGTWPYMAPELLKDSTLSLKLDIYAYAVVLWEMLTGKIPYEGMQYHEIIWHVCRHNKRLEIPSDCPEHVAELMMLCWQEDHKTRPSIDRVLFILDKSCSLDSWKLDLQFAHTDETNTRKLYQACSIAVHNASGDIAANDIHTLQVNVFNKTGEFKTSLGINRAPEGSQIFHKSPRGVAAALEPNRYFMTDDSHYVKVYNSTRGDLVKKFAPFSLEGKPCEEGAWLGGLVVDKCGDLLVGVCKGRNFISRHTQNGDHISTIPVSILPMYLSITPLDTIIVSSLAPNTVQIINKIGQTLHAIKPPSCVTPSRWRPTGICCYDNIIFVANDNQSVPDEFGIYCYSLTCDYLGYATKDVINPTGIAITEDGERLLVAQYDLGNPSGGQGLHGVKIFKRKRDRSIAEQT